MRAGFIPARPERKERNMAVPASKRARAMLPTGCMSPTGRPENGGFQDEGRNAETVRDTPAENVPKPVP